jgi:hypothetical protein
MPMIGTNESLCALIIFFIEKVMFIFLKYPGPYFFYHKEKKNKNKGERSTRARKLLPALRISRIELPEDLSHNLTQKRWDMNKRMNSQLHEIYVSSKLK